MPGKKYSYDYPRPMVTSDIVLLRVHDASLEVLLVCRAKAPFLGRWALPGGFVEMDEPLRDAALRELKEETGLGRPAALLPLGAYGRPGRDPRGRVISIAFLGILSGKGAKPKAGSDAAAAEWRPVEGPPETLAFDHAEIIGDALLRLGAGGRNGGMLFNFLPESFTEAQLGEVLRAVYGFKQDPARYLSAFSYVEHVKRVSGGKTPKYRFAGSRRARNR
jgi:8-oxo-dGTP diphosphatase